MSHRRLVGLAVALQLLVLIGIGGVRQWILMTGTVVLLEGAPVDPRDLFRGDYVILRYRVSTLDPRALGAVETFRAGETVYVGLGQRGQYWEAISVGSRRPRSPFLRGRVWRYFGGELSVEYGIESYFVPEGAGRAIEQRREHLAVEVAVGRDGTAVIRRLFVGGQPLTY